MADAINQAVSMISNSKTEIEEKEKIGDLRRVLRKSSITSFKVMVEIKNSAPISLQDYNEGDAHGELYIVINYDGDMRDTIKWSPININNYYDLFQE